MRYIYNFKQLLNENKTSDKINDFLSDSKLEGKIKKIKVSDLTPAQNEIFLDEIISNLLEKKKFVKKSLNGKLKDEEILVSSDNYIIDGHHKWASVFILNPDCKIRCTKINLPLKESIKILKDLLEEINTGNQRQSGNFKYNIFDMVKSERDDLKKSIVDIFKNKSGNEKKLLKLIKKRTNTDLHPLNFLIKNLYKLPTPDKKSYDRIDMPQMSDQEIDEILN